MVKPVSSQQVELWRQQFEDASPQEVLQWAVQQFQPRIALACSFQAEDMVLLDILASIVPKPRVFYLDTGLLFEETYRLRDQVLQRYDIELQRYAPDQSLAEQALEFGANLWERDPNLCCNLRKVKPLQRALRGLDAWITGIRREQTPERRNAGVVEWDRRFGLVKINPLARWTSGQVRQYLAEHDIPNNPLHDLGYPSIGCITCTAPVTDGSDPRSGRWRGFNKTECGLHVDSGATAGTELGD